MLVFFVLILFILGYGISELSINDGDLLVGYANTGVQECGCSKCHTIELNGCSGCHNSQQDKSKSKESALGSEESNYSDPADSDDNVSSQESQPKTYEPLESYDRVSNKEDNLSNSETAPNKSKQKEPGNNSQK